jgi:hypothetical protein
MTLTLSPSIVEKINIVFPIQVDSNGAVVRVASLKTDYIGVLTANGTSDLVTWTPYLHPAWVSLEVSSDSTSAKIKFTNPTADSKPFQFFIEADDGQTKIQFPCVVEVVEPLLIEESPLSSSPGTLTFLAYDSTVAPVTLVARGLNGFQITDDSVLFVNPVTLPSGLQFVTSNGSTAELVVAPPSISSVSGGIVTTNSSTYEVKAYRPGTMYDSPDRLFSKSFVINALSSKQGYLDADFSCVFDDVHHYIKSNVQADWLTGLGSSVFFDWKVTGTATGTTNSGGSISDNFWNWSPTGSGNVTISLTLRNPDSTAILPTMTFGPFNVTLGSGSWGGTGAVKVLADAPYKTGYVGDTVVFDISTPAGELASGETVTLSFTSFPVSGEPSLGTISGFVLSSGTPTDTISIPVPAGSPFRGKWEIIASATSSTGRTSKSKLLLISNGLPVLTVVSSGGFTLTQDTGSTIPSGSLSATFSAAPVTGVAFSLVGAPAGLLIISNNLVGSVVDPGSYSFSILAQKTGYAPSYQAVTLDVAQVATPLIISSLSSDVVQIQDNTQFHLTWSTIGAATGLFLQKNLDKAEVTGTNGSTQTIFGSSVFSLIGTSYRGKSYSTPLMVVSNSTAGLVKLPSAPTIATIDQNSGLSINWNPTPINLGFSLYRGWNIQYKRNGGSAIQITNADKSLPTGLEATDATLDSRKYAYQLTAGEYELSMQAFSSNRNAILDSDNWDSFHLFPGATGGSTVVADKSTVKIGESLTLTLDSLYTTANYWRITYGDGTSTGWLPISVKTVSKAFADAGTKSILLEFERDYSQNTPPVKLRRSLNLSVYVQNEVYSGTTGGVIGIGNIGLGGEAGFEIVDDTKGNVKLEPYEVIVRALVKDDITQELKLLVATSRTNNASSVLSTMAIDVFPLQGRPHMKDLLVPSLNLNGNLNLVSPVEILTTALPDIIVGKPMPELQFLAVGGTTPYDWYSDSLPFGLKLNIDGTLSGTPMQMGLFNINVSVKDSTIPAYIAEQTLLLNIKTDLTITTSSVSNPQVGSFYQFELVSIGGLPPYSWSLVSGSLPLGVLLDPDTGLLSGYPSTYNSDQDFDTPFSFIAEVLDSIGSKVSKSYTMNLLPMNLTLGNLDQPVINQGENFKMTVPVYGGRSPYHVTDFQTDGVIGNALTILSPDTVDAISGQSTANLSISTGDKVFSASSGYPYNATFTVSASGGTPPYTFTLDTTDSSLNTVGSPYVVGTQAGGTFATDGTKKINIRCHDSANNTVSKVVNLTANANASTYTLEFVTIDKSGSTNSTNWTFTKIASLPDAPQNADYRPTLSTYYGVAVWDNVANAALDLRTNPTQIQLTLLSADAGSSSSGGGGTQTGLSVSYDFPVVRAVNTTVSGGNRIAFGSAISMGPRSFTVSGGSGPYVWSLGARTTTPTLMRPMWSNGSPTIVGSSVSLIDSIPTDGSLGDLAFKSYDYLPSNYPVDAYQLEIVVTDAGGKSTAVLLDYIPQAQATGHLTLGLLTLDTVPSFPTGLVTNGTYTPSRIHYLASPQGTTGGGTTGGVGGSTPYFPIGVVYYQGDYPSLSTVAMTGETSAVYPPVFGNGLLSNGSSNPFTFMILGDTTTPTANKQMTTVGDYSLGIVQAQNGLSKGMPVHCSVAGGGNTPVVVVTSTGLFNLDNSSGALTPPSSALYLCNIFYQLSAVGGTGPYRFHIESGSPFSYGFIFSGYNPISIGPTSLDNALLVYSSVLSQPIGFASQLVVTATDVNGVVSAPATIPIYYTPAQVTNTPIAVVTDSINWIDLIGTPNAMASDMTAYFTGLAVDPLAHRLTANQNVVWQLTTNLPAGLSFSNGVSQISSVGQTIEGLSLLLVGTPSTVVSNQNINLVLSKPGSGLTPLSYTHSLSTQLKAATISFNRTPIQVNTVYSNATNNGFATVSCKGFASSGGGPVLSCNLAPVTAAQTINVVGNPAYAQKFDRTYDFTAPANPQSGTLTLQAGIITYDTKNFTVLATPLILSSRTDTYSVSEYQQNVFNVSTPPITVAGGTGNWGVIGITGLSDTTHFTVRNNGGAYLELNMNSVQAGQSYSCTASFNIQDVSGISATQTGTITVSVYAETTIDIVFGNIVVEMGASGYGVTNAYEVLKTHLGHSPFKWYVDTVTIPVGLTGLVTKSPSQRSLSWNNTGTAISLTDFSDNDVLPLGGLFAVSPSSQTGASYSAPSTALPAAGTHVVTWSIRVVDAKNITQSTTVSVTYIAP